MTATDSQTGTISNTYDALGRLISQATPQGAINYAYDSVNRRTQMQVDGLTPVLYTYDTQHRLLTLTDPRGIPFLSNEHDSANRVSRQTQADGGVWTFAYTSAGGSITATTVTDPRGHRTLSRFNADRYLVSRTDALGQTTTFDRQPGTNLLLSTTDPLGRVSRFTYDGSGNVTSITDPAGNIRTFTYDPVFNKVTSITDPLGNLTTFEYDASGNLIAITDPLQNTRPPAERLQTTFTYNSFGQPLTTTDPLGNTTTFTYDSTGNLAAITDPLGNTTQRTYDLVSRLISQVDPLRKTTRFSYDALNRLVTIVDALNGVASFGYDPNGNLLTVTDARGNTTTHTYDSMDRLATRTHPLGRQEAYQYDATGNLTQFADRKNQITMFTYDPLNRRTRSTYADVSFTELAYDAAGRLLTATDSLTGTITEEYDIVNRLVREATPQGTIQYAYDTVGRRTTMTVNGQSPVSYTYDAASRLTQILQAPLNPVSIQYDAAGRRTLLTLPNVVSTAYDYDGASRLTRLAYSGPAGVLGDLTYQYDSAGNRVAVGGSFARTLLPDAIPTATYDAANQQSAFGNKIMTYDQNGNLLTLTEGAATTAFTWDARNRLVALSGSGLTASFQYNAFSRRTQKVLDGQTTQLHYDGFDIIRELTSGAEVSYLRTLNIDEGVSRGATEFYLTDAQGSTIAVTDAAGSVPTAYTYDPFGRAMANGLVSGNPFQFTGRENDGTGLYSYRARYYNPTLHRFGSEDPLLQQEALQVRGLWHTTSRSSPLIDLVWANTQNLNLYGYAGGNPINYTDPLGLWGGGLIVSGSAEAGAVAAGAGATGSLGGGVFGGGSQGVNLGGFVGFGGFAGGPGYGPSYPGGSTGGVVGGAYAGVGGGLFITNAKCAGELSEPFQTWSFNLGIGPKISVQFGISGGTWIGSATYGYGGVISGSGYPTNTWATGPKKC